MNLIDLDDLGVGMANPAMFENRAYADGWNSLYAILQQAPVVDAEPVRHGRWIEVRDKFNYCIGMKCSSCGRRVRNCGENYCPKCGVKMDGGLPHNLGQEDGGAEG